MIIYQVSYYIQQFHNEVDSSLSGLVAREVALDTIYLPILILI